MDSLPFVYRANRNAWMNSEFFKEWLKGLDTQLQHLSRKVLLLDSCDACPHLNCLKNIQLEFVPPRTTALVQSMDMDIIKNLKTLYHARLVNYILEAIEERFQTSSSKVSILQAVTFVADSWRKVSSETIQNCFPHCGFKHLGLEMDVDMLIKSENDDGHVELQPIQNCE
ncbi:tigger transposable element-derived protein 6-like [Stegodyphus dumicola]|uniref:tigger transposable element-derived protein 6-like n=1 Tax=Stegodyphus dumicola TaxID=202533 RepID=UPI0015AF8A70|nr:tigger transposable element-derived protein 6-like [Stegodyphus dumicola]